MITLEQLLNLYNFRRIDEDRTDYNKYDTDIVRINYGDSMDDYFEFGIYDFGGDTDERIPKILTRELLDTPVDSFRVSNDIVMINIDSRIGKPTPFSEEEE